jgi:cell division protein FtsB
MNVGFSAVDLRNKARNFLKVAQDSATAEKQEDELKKRDAEIAEMKEQIEKLLANSGDKQRLKKEVVINKE